MYLRRIFGVAALVLGLRPVAAQTVGDVLPPWTPGALDIHQISTGRGNSSLFIFPDGTTMLLDAGEQTNSSPRYVSPRPDASRTAGEWISRYVRHMLGHDADPHLDYALVTHFHSDHMGGFSEKSRSSKDGSYKLTGITQVCDRVPIRKIFDRGWPDYNYPSPVPGPDIANYRKFVEWQTSHSGARVERFKPGRNDQIVLVRDPKKYPEFEVRNVSSNGEVWTGVGANTRMNFPPIEQIAAEDRPSENMCSNVFRLSYGRFDYYSGGDIPGIPDEGAPLWHDIETPVAKAVGPVEVAILNHHGYIDTQNAFFVSTLRPRVWLLSVWDSAHPTAGVYRRLMSTRLYPGPRDIFATNMHEANKTVISNLKLTSEHGHIVVRVAHDGSFRVFVLDDTTESYRIQSIHGPYESR